MGGAVGGAGEGSVGKVVEDEAARAASAVVEIQEEAQLPAVAASDSAASKIANTFATHFCFMEFQT